MAAKYLGAHMPTGKGLAQAVHEAKAIGATAMQVFTKSPQLWKAKPIEAAAAKAFKVAVFETGMGPIVCHDSYLINLCAGNPELREKSILGLVDECHRCHTYGITMLNSHMGAHVGQGEEVGLRMIIEATKRLLEETDPSVMVLMETTAGTGTSIGYKFEHLAIVLDGLAGHPRLGVCLDTCHVFSAGYDIQTAENFENVCKEFERVIGWERLKAVHANDSKNLFGSRKDRHESIGKGTIGEDAFRWMINDAKFTEIPILLETPTEDGGHEKDLNLLKSFLA